MKKGFTLIELLAVILILGIIALIAIPTVNKIINEARYGAFKSGNDNIMKTIEQDCQTSIMKGENPILSYVFTEGKSNAKINVKGSLPNDGYILLDKSCTITDYYLTDNKNVYSNNDDVREDYMLQAPSNSESIFKTIYPSYYNNLLSINIINNVNTPNNAIEIKDPSISGNEKIKSWLVPNGDYYDLFVGSNEKIFTNYDSSFLFSNSSATSINLENLYTDFTNNFRNMFDTTLFSNIELDKFNTINATNMYKTFFNNINLKYLDITSWNTSNVTNMYSLFQDCIILEAVNLTKFNTSKVTNMYGMFNNCHKLKSLNLLSFDTSKVTNMQAMFSDCHSLSSLDLTSFNTKNVTTMRYMFGSDKGITNLTNIKGIENFDTSSLTRIDYIFDDCQKLKSLDLSNWDVTKINDMNYAFNGCIILENLNLSNWNIENVTTITGIFDKCYKLSKFNSFKNINLSFSLSSTIIGYDSLLDVINNLKTSTDTKILTISSSQFTLLNQTDINIATNKNWNVSV